jgi:TorA maturation chaperone TorD
VLDDEACRIEMRNEIRRFINLHILSWINKWNEKIQVYSSTLCFKGIGSLVVACIEDIYSMMTSMEPHIN